MSRQRSASGGTSRAVLTFKGGGLDRLKDATSAELAKMAKALGNDEIQGLIAQGEQKRDALLAFIQDRLQQLIIVQQKEQAEMKNRAEWRRQLALGATGFGLPDPTRWRGAALAYRRAAEALCQGNLGRAAELLDRAVEEERVAWQSRPPQMDAPEGASMPKGAPDERALISSGEGATPIAAPGVLQLADRVVRVTDTMDRVPLDRPDRKHRWWEAEEEEESAEKKEAGGKGAGGKEAGEEKRVAVAARRKVRVATPGKDEKEVTPPLPEKDQAEKDQPGRKKRGS